MRLRLVWGEKGRRKEKSLVFYVFFSPLISPSTSCFHKLFSQLNPLQGAVHRAPNSAVVQGAVARGLGAPTVFPALLYLDHGADTLARLALFLILF